MNGCGWLEGFHFSEKDMHTVMIPGATREFLQMVEDRVPALPELFVL